MDVFPVLPKHNNIRRKIMSNINPIIELPVKIDAPILFDEVETPDIPADLLPGIFGDFAHALATATETPAALSVMVVLGVISACVAKRFVISPQKSWQEPINIYTLIALPPANNKSLVLSRCTQPLIEWERNESQRLDKIIKQQTSERKSQEKWIDALRTRAAKEVDREKQFALFQEIADLEVNIIEPEVLPQLFANDATPESLAYSTYEQKGRFAIFSDEGGILETLAGLYSNGAANLDILLKGIDGGEMRIRRKERSFNLNPYLTLVLAVQPMILSNMQNKRAYCGNGALERFLYVLPKSKLGYRTHDQLPLSDNLQQAYNARLQTILNTPPLLKNDQEVARVLTLDTQAQQDWREFQRDIEVQLRPEGKLANCIGWGGKICGFALRISGLLHVAHADIYNTVISTQTMQCALTLSELLVAHAIVAFNLIGIDQPTEDAKEVFNWMKSQSKNNFTQSEIISALKNRKVGKADRLNKALRILMERNIVTLQRIATNKKPILEYSLHPNLHA